MSGFDCVGVDVAKDKFDVSVEYKGKSKHKVFANKEQGYIEFLTWLHEYTINPWVCMEATGHYSTKIADFLIGQGIRVSVVNPFQIKNYAKASLIRNKNDRVDSEVIRQFCKRMEPRPYQASSPEQKEIKDLTKLLDMLKGQLTQLTNQRHSTQGSIAKKALTKLIMQLEKEIAKVEKQIADLIASNSQLKEKLELITSIKGIGNLTAYHILALMPDVNSFSTAKQFAAYTGITPKQRESGTFIGKTTISKLGDARLRKSLYMAALVAKRYNKGLASFVARLQLKGKTPKTIICAVMRKLTHIIFGVLKNKLPYNENYHCI
ncbi:Transposase, IS116/IS110/IS902 (plasmid) [Legionella adelaidensis]|uniref:Transposase n=1 Tax=Legionella adelaidensis TaxID=45056 RepID=A0A0W0R3U1_9GAMM|nr:IS110 family transposase [Legionella adelaidensis]KTC65715.1 transposase [Legionella adelaidensis]VEH85122.1 Transposase, IS116/IS110/IS902 [Legionella adelaidensis]VEH85303.1 Transposase, IS116/IS110/IS902 [Legionella adelaidensis]VEH85465.1 Transposase, IS116/IS110/IS902 [Legionella adelaidensis]VEH85997.1 Transposase, IS116/IS110/IS902 [Legionella adelaidensis]